MLSVDKGSISLLGLNSSNVMPWAFISGNSSAWIDAFGPLRSFECLQISGDTSLAAALLNALAARS